MDLLEQELRTTIKGEVHFDEISRRVYSVDASIFEVVPLGIVIPKTKEDLQQIVHIARLHHIPLTIRGAATGITGGCLGHGLIVDLSKYLNRILTINIEKEYALCEPGVIQDDLNHALASFGYRLGPDTSTGNRATLGGMLANNSAGARSLRYGKMSDHIEEVELLLSTGRLLTFSSISEEEWGKKRELDNQEGEIYRALWQIKEDDSDEIRNRFPSIPRRVSGYNLDELLTPNSFNVAKLIAGSEGTLGIATQIKMHIVPRQKETGLLLIFFDDLLEAFRQAPPLLQFHPLSLELIDEQIISLGRTNPSIKHSIDWLHGNPKALLVVELEAPTAEEVQEQITRLHKKMEEHNIGYKRLSLLEKEKMNQVWTLRKAGLGILLSKRTYSRAIAFLEDLSLPPERLAPFMERFCAYLASKGKEAGIYGHVGAGCMHIRPYINLRDPAELELIRQMMLDVSSLVLEYGGALSGEHGDGLIRSWLNPKMFGERIMQAFSLVKKAFDPLDLMNPGKKIPLSYQWEEMRANPGGRLQNIETFLNFEREGGFGLAADLCNGNGLCRKKEGVMCPSFQATGEEFHSTRARAQSLRAIIHGRLPLDSFTSQGLYDVMDLCLSCKGCKTECPSQVDMAKFKSEFLYHYQKKHGYSLRSRVLGNIALLFSLASPFASLVNWMNQSFIIKHALSWIGFSSKRTFPSLAKKRFSSWFKDFKQPIHLTKEIALFNDTFTEFNHPQVGEAAVRLFNALGYKVFLIPHSCCGRPALSKGLLDTAKKQGQALIQKLSPYAEKEIPIIGLEPSCLLTLRDDYHALIHAEGMEIELLDNILSLCWTLDEFLAQLIDKSEWSFPSNGERRQVKVHGHCYQKALVGMGPTLKVLRAVPGFNVEEIPSGCCGMAGSFGYEKEHEALSMKIGELRLFPTVRDCGPDEWVIASGTSCRQQINDGTQKHPLHLAEALFKALSNSSQT